MRSFRDRLDDRGGPEMIAAAQELAPQLNQVRESCDVLGVSRASYYRAIAPPKKREPRKPVRPSNALSEAERQQVLDVLHSEAYIDCPPAAVFNSLLDKGEYLASERTMYRILADNDEVKERRAQRRHPQYAKPELIATGPNQVWCWDITKIKGAVKWLYFHLYVMLDIFSRCVVGWMLAPREAGYLAEQFIKETCTRQGIEPGQLTIHSDRGPAMQSGPVVHLHARLGITKSNSRPHVSNDNPFSESQFKTLKYRPGFPDRFGGFEDALAFCEEFFPWYNNEHYHSAIAFLTPADVHYGRADEILAARHATMMEAYAANPRRFIKGPPKPTVLERAVYINPPTTSNCSLN